MTPRSPTRHLDCVSASKEDPTPSVYQPLDFLCEFRFRWAPVGADGDPTIMLILAVD
jgi:hypothetical protein